MNPDAASWERMLASMRVFFRPIGSATDGYRVIERDGVLGTITPGEPVYERLGYRRFGTIEMWERRRAVP
jgi:hypothetical protein